MIGRVALFSLLALGIGTTGAARADTFDFAYSGAGISAMGTLTATLQSPGRYLITGITGERNNIPITALLAPGTAGYFAPNDNLLFFPSNPYLDQNGFAYSTATGSYNVFHFGSTYSEAVLPPNVANAVSFSVSARGAPAPVPGGGLLSFLALGLAGLVWRGRAIMGRCRSYLAPSHRPAAG